MWQVHNKPLSASLSHLKVQPTAEGGRYLVTVSICFTPDFYFVPLNFNQLTAEWRFNTKASHWAVSKFSHSDGDCVLQSDQNQLNTI
jgi:hypothetical protein